VPLNKSQATNLLRKIMRATRLPFGTNCLKSWIRTATVTQWWPVWNCSAQSMPLHSLSSRRASRTAPLFCKINLHLHRVTKPPSHVLRAMHHLVKAPTMEKTAKMKRPPLWWPQVFSTSSRALNCLQSTWRQRQTKWQVRHSIFWMSKCNFTSRVASLPANKHRQTISSIPTRLRFLRNQRRISFSISKKQTNQT